MRMYGEVDLDNVYLTSRSAIETHLNCERERYLNYLYRGVGIVPKRSSIPLSTGSMVHKGIQVILTDIKLRPNLIQDLGELVDHAVNVAVSEYKKEVGQSGLHGRDIESKEKQEFTIAEQLALAEALIRCWAKVEMSYIIKHYDILSVEEEKIYPLGVTANGREIVLQSRIDAVLQKKEEKDVVVYSLKTAKKWSDRAERGYRKDLQGVTEILAAEGDFWGRRENIEKAISLLIANPISEGQKITNYLNKEKQKIPKFISGVRFCFLIKGERRWENRSTEPEKEDKWWYTDSSLIYGYRSFSPNGVKYAHTNKVVKPENKSGYGMLGKGWEQFRVWEGEEKKGKGLGGVKGWIEKIWRGEIQGDLPFNPVKDAVVTPAEVWRNEEQLAERLMQIRRREKRVFEALGKYRDEEEKRGEFDQNTQHCHFPDECDYLPLCWGEEPYTGKGVPVEVMEDPLGSGWYEWRRPHHEAELIQIQGSNKKE